MSEVRCVVTPSVTDGSASCSKWLHFPIIFQDGHMQAATDPQVGYFYVTTTVIIITITSISISDMDIFQQTLLILFLNGLRIELVEL